MPRYIDKLTSEMKDTGNLEGILLTGLTRDGVELMETYVDRTGDVQTASFCMLKVHRLLRAHSQRSLKNNCSSFTMIRDEICQCRG